MRNEDMLIVAIDIDPSGKDEPLMMVTRKDGDSIKIINVIDKDAVELYEKLLGDSKSWDH